jgi:hypothetical protein
VRNAEQPRRLIDSEAKAWHFMELAENASFEGYRTGG